MGDGREGIVVYKVSSFSNFELSASGELKRIIPNSNSVRCILKIEISITTLVKLKQVKGEVCIAGERSINSSVISIVVIEEAVIYKCTGLILYKNS